MKKRNPVLVIALIAVFMVIGLQSSVCLAEKKAVDVSHMTTPFGSVFYSQGIAFEQVFGKANSWVRWKVQETPGGFYIFKTIFNTRDKMISGEVPWVVWPGAHAITPFLLEGRKPFNKIPLRHVRALFSMPSYLTFYVTFDPNIKSLTDLEGKSIGLPAKARAFQSVLASKFYFEKGLNIWDKIDKQYIGVQNSKNAMLDGRVDAHYATFSGTVEKTPDGTYICKKLAPSTAVMELMSSGKKLYFIPWDPKILKKATDPAVDMVYYPTLVKKGACKGLEQDVQLRASMGTIYGDEAMPEDMLEEIIRVRTTFLKELGKHHDTLNYVPENPWPIGNEAWVHPKLESVMKKLGIPIP